MWCKWQCEKLLNWWESKLKSFFGGYSGSIYQNGECALPLSSEVVFLGIYTGDS